MATTLTAPPTDNIGGAHTTVISIGVMLLVLIILVELAGTSHTAAMGVGVLLLSAIVLAGFKASPGQLATIEKYPQVPVV